MLLKVVFIFSTLVILSQKCIWSKKISGLDVLIIDMENSNMIREIRAFLACLFKIFDFNVDDAHSHFGYGCAIYLADPNENGYLYRLSERGGKRMCGSTYGNGDLDKTLTGTRKKVDDSRENASMITIVITGANLINTDLSIENQRTFRDAPNMLVVITLTDDIVKMKIFPAATRMDRIITFDNCADSFKDNFHNVLCSPEHVVGNCSYDNKSDSFQRVILERPGVKRANTICPEKYWKILKAENCSIILNKTTVKTATRATLLTTMTDYHNNTALYVINVIGIAMIIAAIVAIVWIVYHHYSKRSKKKQKQIDSLKDSTLFLEESIASKSAKILPIKSEDSKNNQSGQIQKSTKRSFETFAKKLSTDEKVCKISTTKI